MAFYLKYRSQTISELDSEKVRGKLTNILESKSLPHALLFTGPRGTGKTSSARILAKAVNCEAHIGKKNKTSGEKTKTKKTEKKANQESDVQEVTSKSFSKEPCNTCSACQSITAGTALDVIEVDAASHRGIDDIRDLREKVRLAPSELKYKIYIIDEVHMLTNEAFNALLKTLEEPPENVIFILCTTELQKLPKTIVSRCIQVKFTRASEADIVHSLSRVVEGEKIKIDKSVLQIIARHADGSFRDAQKMLEQLSWRKEPMTEQSVQKFLGMEGNNVRKIEQLLLKKDTKQILQLIEVFAEEGQNIKAIFVQLLEKLHSQLLFLHGVSDSKPEENFWKPEQMTELRSLIELLNQALSKLKNSPIVQLPIELALIEWTSIPQTSAVQPRHSQASSVTTNKPTAPIKTATTSYSPPTSTFSTDQAIKSHTPSVNSSELSTQTLDVELTLENLTNHWDNFLLAVKPKNHSVQALLRSSKLQSVDGSQVSIEVWYPFHYERLNTIQCRQIVEQTLTELFNNQDIRINYVLGQKVQATNHSISNMISETELPPVKKTTKSRPYGNDGQVNDRGNRGYQTRKTSPSSPPPTEEDDELIKFAEKIFGE